MSHAKLGTPIACAAVLFCLVVLAVCALPPNQLPAGMLAALVLLLVIVYAFVVRGRFTGPAVKLANLERAPFDDANT